MQNLDLKNLRAKIDLLDNNMLELLAKRFEVVRKIGEIKKIQNLKPLDEKRFKEILKNKLILADKLKLPKSFIKELFNLIHNYSLKEEEK